MADGVAPRLDTFVDAAFAFAVTFMVVGAGSATIDANLLRNSVASIPAFAIAFAIIALFWHAHVRWRKLRGEGDWRSLVLSLVLTFLVLVYVVPLRAMAGSFAAFLGGRVDGFRGSLAELFAVYGAGFVAMSTITALLFRDALRNDTLLPEQRKSVAGQAWIWVILAVTGLVSVGMSQVSGVHYFAPFAYSTLPLTIGLFVRRWWVS